MMLKVTENPSYPELRAQIADTLASGRERARKAVDRQQLLSYREVGQILHVHLLEHQDRAQYGDSLVQRLADDIGLPRQRLYDMLRLYRFFPIVQPVGQLGWSHYQLLLTVRDDAERERLRDQAEAAGMTKTALGEAVRKARSRKRRADRTPPDRPVVKRILAKRGALHTYRVIAPASGSAPRLDIGFGIHPVAATLGLTDATPGTTIQAIRDPSTHGPRAAYAFRTITDRAAAFYSYRALVERVIDGDTLWLEIDCGFGIWTRQKIRLRGIDAPEMGTPEGAEARAYVKQAVENGRRLRGNGKWQTEMAVTTTQPDKYDRYLADVFYRNADAPRAKAQRRKESQNHGTTPPMGRPAAEVLREGVFLNRDLVERGLARRV